MEFGGQIIVLTGATGYLGTFVADALLDSDKKLSILSLTRRTHPLFAHSARFHELHYNQSDWTQVREELLAAKPIAFVHMAAMSSAAACEQHPQQAQVANVEYFSNLMDLSAQSGAYLIGISSDLVFDGAQAPQGGFQETQQPAPISVYARTKRAMEICAESSRNSVTVLRSSLIYGPELEHSNGGQTWMMKKFQSGEQVPLFRDEWRTPVVVYDVVKSIIALLLKPIPGLFHVAGPDLVTRAHFGRIFAKHFGYSESLIQERNREDEGHVPFRPENVALNAKKAAEQLRLRFSGVEEGLSFYPQSLRYRGKS